MRTLAIECATEACSVALFDGEALIAGGYEVLGRGHAERLVPMIAQLPGKGHAQRILVSRGPGSFTGVRIGIAAAQGLGLAWTAQVLGYPTLALVAAMARKEHPAQVVTVCMAGGHGEWFVQDFASDGLPPADAVSLTPPAAAARATSSVIAGSRAASLAEMLDGRALGLQTLLPDARQAMLLPPAILTNDLTPIYGRGPDAQPARPRTHAQGAAR